RRRRLSAVPRRQRRGRARGQASLRRHDPRHDLRPRAVVALSRLVPRATAPPPRRAPGRRARDRPYAARAPRMLGAALAGDRRAVGPRSRRHGAVRAWPARLLTPPAPRGISSTTDPTLF